jgi:succinate dehydrogenase/fumarate reductase-like Fe-S protein
MNFTLKVWRQSGPKDNGRFEVYPAVDIPSDASFLEMLDIVNEGLIEKNVEPIAFDHDCREGICGTCSLTINGEPHGPGRGTTCQLYMRKFHDRDVITVEPFRAMSFPVMRDLVVDRSAFDRIIQSGGFITERCGAARRERSPDPENHLLSPDEPGGLHRLRDVRRGVPKQLRDARRQRENKSSRTAAARQDGETPPGAQDGSHHGPRGLWKLLELLRL